MQTRTLGNTGIRVPVIGFGAWQLGNARDFGPMQTPDAVALVHAAIDMGCNFFDTAPNYGKGTSESLLGEALKGRRPEVVISSKFGHHADGRTDYSAGQMAQSVEGSLKRLQTDHLDILLLHNPPMEALDGASPQFEQLRKLKAQGKVLAYGASVDWGREVNHLLSTSDAQVIELLLNIFHQEPVATFELVAKKNVGVIAKVPLDSGWLAGKYTRHSRFEGIRKRWSEAVIERRAGLVELTRFMTAGGLTMTQAALQFLLAWPEVTTVIPGVRNMAQLREDLSAGEGELPAGTIARLRALWETHLKSDPLPW